MLYDMQQGIIIKHDVGWIKKIMIILFGIVILCWIGMGIIEKNVRRIQVEDYEIVENTNEFEYGIDVARRTNDIVNGDLFEINGWCIIRGIETRPISMHVVIESNNEYFLLPTVVRKREDITAGMNDGVNYDWSGFSSSINNASKIFGDRTNNKIYILFETKDDIKLIPIDVTIDGV